MPILALLLLAGAWLSYSYFSAVYPQADEETAANLVKQYYTYLRTGSYSQALYLVALPADEIRDWSYEQRWRAGSSNS